MSLHYHYHGCVEGHACVGLSLVLVVPLMGQLRGRNVSFLVVEEDDVAVVVGGNGMVVVGGNGMVVGDLLGGAVVDSFLFCGVD